MLVFFCIDLFAALKAAKKSLKQKKSTPKKQQHRSCLILKTEQLLFEIVFARSTAIKNLLIEHGLSPRQVSVSSKKDNTLNANKDKIIDRGFAFSVENLKNSGGNSKKIRAMVEHISKDPVLVRFLPAKFNAVLYNEEKHKLKTLANFLNASDSLSCTIVGHTDSSWNHESNMSLGKKRAEFTKIKLIEYNVDASKIKTISKGETSPIASNLTEKGKAMNRRTEVIIN